MSTKDINRVCLVNNSVQQIYKTDTLKTLHDKRKSVLVMAMVGKRDRVEIMADILSLCSEPKTKTHVMYGTNLSWKMLQYYLSELQSMELLEVHKNSTSYVTTKRGLVFVKKWKELQKLL